MPNKALRRTAKTRLDLRVEDLLDIDGSAAVIAILLDDRWVFRYGLVK